MNEKQHPLILVFYLDSEMMQEAGIIQPFVEYVNDMIQQKDANMMAFFLPTKGEERIECINPTVVAEADMEKITKMMDEIKEQFSVGADDMNIPDQASKPCECENNPGGNCKCNE